MKLSFNRSYKSVSRFESIELPKFTILTGVNGAGKSHLLEAIEGNHVSIEGITPNQPHGPTPIRRFDWSTLVPQDTGAFSQAQISAEQTGFWNEVAQHRQQPIAALREQLQRFNAPGLEKLNIKALMTLQEPELASFGLTGDRASEVLNLIRHAVQNGNQQVTQLFVRNDPQNRSRLISSFAASAPLPLFAMEQDDFYGAYPKMWQPVDLFQQSFARLFTAYQRHWSQNKLKAIGQTEGASVVPLSEAEFLAKHGQPPWEFLNEVLESAELDFRINAPYKWDDRPYEPILTDAKRDIHIKFTDLSSGEKILMSFALCLYHAGDPNSSVDFPKVLLFDEIDAPLHPSMTRSLLRTIQLILVEKHKICVILTTHSPSTVALAPESSIHVMRKHGGNRLQKTAKDTALGILTAGVPTLSVNYENRRQVFVESKYDVEYYSGLYQHSKPHLIPEISLVFIATGPGGNGNCDQVRTVVNQLVAGGNRTTLGVIDWDLSNSKSGAVFVLGEGERYSIENFLLDPTLLALLLLREKFLPPERLGLPQNHRYTDMMALTQNSFQGLVDHVVADVIAAGALPVTGPAIDLEYVGGLKLSAPEWFLRMQGHSLEQCFKQAYPQLQRYRNEPDLKAAIITKVVDDFPQLIPATIVSLFRSLQSDLAAP